MKPAQASSMGRRAHAMGRAHAFTAEERKRGGDRAGARAAAKGAEYMAALGRKGGQARAEQMRRQAEEGQGRLASTSVHDTEPAPPPSRDDGARADGGAS